MDSQDRTPTKGRRFAALALRVLVHLLVHALIGLMLQQIAQ